jgi:hypothetical protein
MAIRTLLPNERVFCGLCHDWYKNADMSHYETARHLRALHGCHEEDPCEECADVA